MELRERVAQAIASGLDGWNDWENASEDYRAEILSGADAVLDVFLIPEELDEIVDVYEKAFWIAYPEAIRNAPSNREGQGVSSEDGRAASRIGKEAGLRAALEAIGLRG